MEKKKAYAVSTAHLDTVWRWTISKTINEFIPDTLTKNFDLIEKYPNYKFNFEGAYRYEIIEQISDKSLRRGDINIAVFISRSRKTPSVLI